MSIEASLLGASMFLERKCMNELIVLTCKWCYQVHLKSKSDQHAKCKKDRARYFSNRKRYQNYSKSVLKNQGDKTCPEI
jgi:hypothetical protein